MLLLVAMVMSEQNGRGWREVRGWREKVGGWSTEKGYRKRKEWWEGKVRSKEVGK